MIPHSSSSPRTEERRPAARCSILLEGGFRPFFLMGALWVPLALAAWVLMLNGTLTLPSAFDPLAWHQHELLFGYAAAIVAGFALTAVPNWTGQLPIRGLPLGWLALLWLAGRVAVANSAIIGALPALLIDVSFLSILSALVMREIRAGRNWRNLPVAGLLGLFALANLLTHLEPAAGLHSGAVGTRFAIAVLITLIALIGGRVVPSFTRNWLAKQGAQVLPVPLGTFDKIALLVLVVALLAWVAVPDGMLIGLLLTAAGLLHVIRLGRWQGRQTGREALVLILHAGYAWMPTGLLLMGLERLWSGPWPFASLHALSAGAIGTMTLAIMTRASLGHTGRPLHAGTGTVLIYACVIMGALLRVASPALPGDPLLWLSAAASIWSGAFLLFVLIYGPMLAHRPAHRAA